MQSYTIASGGEVRGERQRHRCVVPEHVPCRCGASAMKLVNKLREHVGVVGRSAVRQMRDDDDDTVRCRRSVQPRRSDRRQQMVLRRRTRGVRARNASSDAAAAGKRSSSGDGRDRSDRVSVWRRARACALARPRIVPAVLGAQLRSWHENLRRVASCRRCVAFATCSAATLAAIGVRRDDDRAAEAAAGHPRAEDVARATARSRRGRSTSGIETS